MLFVDFLDVDGREMTEVISIDQDDVDDVIIIDAGIDDVAFANEHLDDIVPFGFFCKRVETCNGFLKIRRAADLRQEDDGDAKLFGKVC